jgi:hypothetical protein
MDETNSSNTSTLSPPPTALAPEAVPVKPSADGDDETDYFKLAEPINVDGRSIDRLRINPKGVLKGKQFFSLVQRYQRRYPDEARSNFNKFTSENYLSLVLAEINKIAPEDLYKLPYEDLPVLFLRAASFHFSAGVRQATPVESESEA